jgi:arylformamidase
MSRRWVLPMIASAFVTTSMVQASSPKDRDGAAPVDGPSSLDAQFDHSIDAPNSQQVLGRWRSNSDEVRAVLGEPLRLAYGRAPNQRLDIYKAAVDPAPVQIFIHGGEWRRGSSRASGYAAESFVRAGIHFIALDFVNADEAGGRLDELLSKLKEAIVWIYKHAGDFGGDRSRIHIAGHSSGAHLAAMLLITDWAAEFNVPSDVLKTGILCSGLYDLESVSHSTRSQYLHFNPDIVARLSPSRQAGRVRCPLVLAYASLDSAEFQRQTLDFAALCKRAGVNVRILRCEGYNHFEAIETLGNPFGILGRAALMLIDSDRSQAV